jgi:uncharacterized protein
MKRITWIVFGWIALVITVNAASFDCEKASTQIEKMICADSELSELDSEMEKSYSKAKSLNSSRESEIISDQKKWLKTTRDKCNDEYCLDRVYVLRIDRLFAPFRNTQINRAEITNVNVNSLNMTAFIIANPNERNDSFNGDLEGYGSKEKITKCKILIELPVGVADGNHSYGGICSVTEKIKQSDILICDDEMVGHLKIEHVNHRVSMHELVNFIASNCVGG